MQMNGRSSILIQYSQTSNPCLQAHVPLLDYACSLLLCAILITSFNIHSKITVKKGTATITTSRLKAQAAIPGFLVHVSYSKGFVHWLTINKRPKLFPSYLDNERRKIQNRIHGQKMTHRSSVVLKSFWIRGQADLAPKDVSSSWGYWMVTDKPNTLHPVLFICSLTIL